MTFDASSAGTAASVLTLSHTSTGSNLLMFVMASYDNSHGSIVAAKYNNVDLAHIDTAVDGASTLKLYSLASPTTGANNLVITGSANNTNIGGCVSTYTGAKQTGIDNHATAGPTTTASYSQSLTTVADNCWVIMAGIAEGGSALTAGSNTVVRQQPEVAFRGTFLTDSNSAKTPPGSDTLAVTSASQTFVTCMASFAPFVAGNTVSSLSLLRA